MRQDEIAWDQAQTEGNEILAEYPTQNLVRLEKKCYDETSIILPVDYNDTPIYSSISANRPPKHGATPPMAKEVSYAIPEVNSFELGV